MMVELELNDNIVVSDSVRQQLRLLKDSFSDYKRVHVRIDQKFVKLPWKIDSKPISVNTIIKSKNLIDVKSLEPILSEYFLTLSVEQRIKKIFIKRKKTLWETTNKNYKLRSNNDTPHLKSRYPLYVDMESRISKDDPKQEWLLFYLMTEESNDL